MPETTEEARLPQQGHCVRCQITKPANLFRKDAAGRLTTWCESCRIEKAKAWGVEEDEIELAYFLYAFEEGMKSEVLLTARAQGHGAEIQAASRLKILDMNRPMRIPARVRAILEEHRQAYYHGLGIDAPALLPAAGL